MKKLELLLLECSNLEGLPPSVAALSSLTRFELTRTQIKYLPVDIFQEMKKLRSLKLIENKNFLFAPGLVSKARGLIYLHIEGCEPMMTEVEVALEGHPTHETIHIYWRTSYEAVVFAWMQKLGVY